jgi:hypothetical protein
MFDVFIKSKVLEVCGNAVKDVLGIEENQKIP